MTEIGKQLQVERRAELRKDPRLRRKELASNIGKELARERRAEIRKDARERREELASK